MSSPSRKADWPFIAGIVAPVLLVVALGVYVWGYVALGKFETILVDRTTKPKYSRSYSHQWQVVAFYPASCVESLIRRHEVFASGP